MAAGPVIIDADYGGGDPGRLAVPAIFANHKGGVGKTFVMCLMAAELAQRRNRFGNPRRVLCLDMDPQGNLTRRMGYLEEEIDERPSMAEAIYAATPESLQACLIPCQWEADWAENITLGPARIELENRIPEAGIPGSHLRLRKALTPLLHLYDDVLIDVAPTLGHLLHLSLACRKPDENGHGVNVISVMTPNYDGIRGVRRLERLIRDPDYHLSLNMQANMFGVVINGVRSGVLTHEERTAEAEETWSGIVWTPYLHLSASAERAVEFSEPPQSAESAATRTAMRQAAETYVDHYLTAIGEPELRKVTA